MSTPTFHLDHPIAPDGVAGAKHRAARRAVSEGGTMFIVAMTIAVLASIGAWALQSAALEIKMAGYERQNTQTHYVAEYGTLAAMQNLSATRATMFLDFAMNGVNGARASCLSVPLQADPAALCMSKACFRWLGASNVTHSYNSTMPPLDTDAGTPGALGPLAGSFGPTYTQGDFAVELSDVAEGPKQAGTSSMGFYWVTLTTYGKTFTGTVGGSHATSATSSFGSEGDEIQRTRVLAGPIPKLGPCTLQ